MVVALGFGHPRPLDAEDGDLAPVRPAHLDAAQLAAAGEPERPEEDVVGLKHGSLPVLLLIGSGELV